MRVFPVHRASAIATRRRFRGALGCTIAIAHVATWVVPCPVPGGFERVAATRASTHVKIDGGVDAPHHAHAVVVAEGVDHLDHVDRDHGNHRTRNSHVARIANHIDETRAHVARGSAKVQTAASVDERVTRDVTILKAQCLCGCSSSSPSQVAPAYVSPMLPPASMSVAYHTVTLDVRVESSLYSACGRPIPDPVPIHLSA